MNICKCSKVWLEKYEYCDKKNRQLGEATGSKIQSWLSPQNIVQQLILTLLEIVRNYSRDSLMNNCSGVDVGGEDHGR